MQEGEEQRVNDERNPKGVVVDVPEEGWWGLYEFYNEVTWVPCRLVMGEDGVWVEVGGGEKKEYTADTVRDVLSGVEATSTHLAFDDKDGDKICIIPLFDEGITYTVNGHRRPGYPTVHLSPNHLTFTKHSISRAVPLPSVHSHVVYPLRRLLQACTVSHNLGPEPPSVVGSWSLTESPVKKGVYYWKDFERKVVSVEGPSREEVEAEIKAGVLGKEGSSPAHERLRKHIVEKGMVEVRVAGDGHCQFRSVAHHVYGDAGEFSRVRDEVCRHMKERSTDYELFCVTSHTDNYQTYLEKMGSAAATPEWGDALTLQASANFYNTCFHIITSSSTETTTINPSDPQGDVKVAWLSYLELPNAMHYNPLMPRQGSA